ncbi:MAG TPA: TonB family protein [Steroidobacteraceae bacterium]|nr:TonB family protein [Steroidobacteraceae bacterium]
MQSTRQNGISAASHADTKSTRNVLDVVILTADSRLLATLHEACTSEHAIHHVETAEAAVDLLVNGRCGIFIADLGTLHGNAAPLLTRLNAQFPELILMATGRREEEASVTPLVSSGRVYRFLHKPISPPRAQLFIGAATRRYQEMQAFEPIALATVRTVRTMAGRSPIRRYAAGAIAVIAILCAVVLWRSNEKHSMAPTVQHTASGPTTQDQVADYLARANIALATGRLAEPKGDNALEFYQRVLRLQPNNRDARAGIQRTFDALTKQIEAAIASRNLRDAAASLAQLQRVQPNHPRLAEFRQSIAVLQRARVAVPPPPTQEPDVAPAEAAENAAAASDATTTVPEQPNTLAQDSASQEPQPAASSPSSNEPATPSDGETVIAEELAIATRLRERGVLIEPPGDNAFERLLELHARSPDSPSVRAEQQRLAFALLEQTRTALAANDTETADRFVKAAETLLPGMTTTRTLQQQVDAARAQAQANAPVQAALLPRRQEVAANYPLDARRRGIEGWVDIEFTITPQGDTDELIVRDADPRDVFEKAALDAVKRWKFEPVIKNGAATSQRAILRVRFTMTN